MKTRFLLALLCFLAPAALRAQIRVELSFDQEVYLPREPINAVVLVYNSSGQTLDLGKEPHWLHFNVESVDGKIIRQLHPVDVEGEFSLPSAHRAKKVVNLAEAYELTQFGRYNVTATVRIASWNNEAFASSTKHFGVSNGVTLWEGAFGIPSPKSDERPEIRKFQLVQANHVKSLSLYVRVTDEFEHNVFSLSPLGPLLGLSRPEAQVDRWSNLHIFYQDGARSFRYYMITPDGMILARQTWMMTESRPSLKPGDDGRISVAGGMRRVSGTDLPPPELLSENTPPPVEEPVADLKTDGSKSTKK